MFFKVRKVHKVIDPAGALSTAAMGQPINIVRRTPVTLWTLRT